ncbi:ABC transporter permease [Mongoliimonas terrestris]|uniref:ABC transporter permease n=1 Tax=Mongoliimonas terrestris TaxID=1709001 RepID=UPI00094989E0|nr:ABC transporter permease [Mongoliimonas terrestris]
MSAAAEAARAREVRSRRLLALPALVILALAAIGPLLVVFVYSFLTPGPYGDVVWTFSTDAWTSVFLERDIFDDTLSLADAHMAIFARSVMLALATTVLALLIGFPTAYFIATRPERTRELWLFLVTVPFWTNILIRTFGMLEIIRNEGLINTVLGNLGLIEQPIQMLFTDGAVMAGMLYVYLPLMVLPLYASLDKLDFRLVEAGYDLYATPFRVLTRIILPLVRPGMIAGSILVFIPALGAYVTPRVLGGGKTMMFGTLIELQFGQGRNWPLGAALSITLMALVMVALLVYVRHAGREARHG